MPCRYHRRSYSRRQGLRCSESWLQRDPPSSRMFPSKLPDEAFASIPRRTFRRGGEGLNSLCLLFGLPLAKLFKLFRFCALLVELRHRCIDCICRGRVKG